LCSGERKTEFNARKVVHSSSDACPLKTMNAKQIIEALQGVKAK